MVYTVRPLSRRGGTRSVTSARHSISARAVVIVTQLPFLIPFSAASSREISQNISGCSSESQESQRDMPPAVWCSVSRYVVSTYGKRGSSYARWYGLSARRHSLRAGLHCCCG